MPSYTPATRADLVPGAVFVVREVYRWQTEYGIANGDHIVLTQDDGTNCPYFDKEGGAGRHLSFAFEQLERVHPPAADTVAIPREVAREFVRTHSESGWAEIRGSVHACAVLRAAIIAADLTLLDPPPPTPDEVAAARLVIERAGMRVVS